MDATLNNSICAHVPHNKMVRNANRVANHIWFSRSTNMGLCLDRQSIELLRGWTCHELASFIIRIIRNQSTNMTNIHRTHTHDGFKCFMYLPLLYIDGWFNHVCIIYIYILGPHVNMQYTWMVLVVDSWARVQFSRNFQHQLWNDSTCNTNFSNSRCSARTAQDYSFWFDISRSKCMNNPELFLQKHRN